MNGRPKFYETLLGGIVLTAAVFVGNTALRVTVYRLWSAGFLAGHAFTAANFLITVNNAVILATIGYWLWFVMRLAGRKKERPKPLT